MPAAVEPPVDGLPADEVQPISSGPKRTVVSWGALLLAFAIVTSQAGPMGGLATAAFLLPFLSSRWNAEGMRPMFGVLRRATIPWGRIRHLGIEARFPYYVVRMVRTGIPRFTYVPGTIAFTRWETLRHLEALAEALDAGDHEMLILVPKRWMRHASPRLQRRLVAR